MFGGRPSTLSCDLVGVLTALRVRVNACRAIDLITETAGLGIFSSVNEAAADEGVLWEALFLGAGSTESIKDGRSCEGDFDIVRTGFEP